MKEAIHKKMPAKLVPIGNSRGIRIPKPLLQKYGYKDELLLEETGEGLLLLSKKQKKLSWEETYQEIAKRNEKWDDFESTVADGFEQDKNI